MARTPTTVARPAPPLLTKPRDDARAQLLARCELGKAVQALPSGNIDTYDAAEAEFLSWDSYNHELLRRMFTTDEYNNSYRSTFVQPTVNFGGPTFYDKVQRLSQNLAKKIRFLTSLAERLDLIDEAPDLSSTGIEVPARVPAVPVNKRVFIVHGQDNEAKAIVSRFVEKCGLEPVILHEQSDRGRTIIEKFEQEADASFAVVLLTPDDVGGLAAPGDTPSSIELKYRARQNVILELGYFVGRLGRSRVCALRKGDVELPSDFSGVIYTALTADEGWKIKLAKELNAAGYGVDLNIALR